MISKETAERDANFFDCVFKLHFSGEPDACLWLIQDGVVLILGDRTAFLESDPEVESQL